MFVCRDSYVYTICHRKYYCKTFIANNKKLLVKMAKEDIILTMSGNLPI